MFTFRLFTVALFISAQLTVVYCSDYKNDKIVPQQGLPDRVLFDDKKGIWIGYTLKKNTLKNLSLEQTANGATDRIKNIMSRYPLSTDRYGNPVLHVPENNKNNATLTSDQVRQNHD